MTEPLFPLFENSPYTKLTGIEFTRRSEGYSQAVLKITEPVLRLTNGSVHGGAIATLVDVGMAAALLTRIKNDEMAATIQLQINYLAASQTGVLILQVKNNKERRKDCCGRIRSKKRRIPHCKSNGNFHNL